jgi:signal transduction histidine kinase
MADDTQLTSFARLVSLACHDLRTPLATAYGFARTISRVGELDERQTRYVGMIEAASEQMTDILEELGLVARIEASRWEPNLQEADSLELAQAAAAAVDGVSVSGEGGPVTVDRDAAVRALTGIVRAAVRHGGVDALSVEVAGTDLTLTPVPEAGAAVLVGDELRDLGGAVGRRVVEAMGGSLTRDGDALVVSLPG